MLTCVDMVDISRYPVDMSIWTADRGDRVELEAGGQEEQRGGGGGGHDQVGHRRHAQPA